MQETDLFQLALGLASPWMVTRSGFDAVDGRLDLYVDFPRGSRLACGQCGREGCAVHDTKEDTWRHLDFFQHRTLLHARTPRGDVSAVRRAQGGDAVGSRGIGFHVAVRGLCAGAGQDDADRQYRRQTGEHDTRLWRIVEHYVWRAVEKLVARVRRMAADQLRRGAATTTSACSLTWRGARSLYVAEGKDAATVKEFADFLEAHGGRREAVTDASIDMGAAFEAGIKENFPTPRSRSTNFTSSNSPTRPSTRFSATIQITTSRSRAGATSS